MSRLYSFVAVALLVGPRIGADLPCIQVDRISAVGALATVLVVGTLTVVATALADSFAQEHHGLHRNSPGAR